MSKCRLALALVLGVLLAVFVSACGVALGPVQFTTGGPAIMNPALSGLHVPGLAGVHQPAVMSSMHHVQYMTSTSAALTLYGHAAGGCHELP